jgi:hypothetical protein
MDNPATQHNTNNSTVAQKLIINLAEQCSLA